MFMSKVETLEMRISIGPNKNIVERTKEQIRYKGRKTFT